MPIKDNTLENISFSTWIHLWTLLINVIDVIMSISKTLMVHTCSKHQQAHVWPPGLLPPWCLWLATPGGLDANTNRAAAVLPTAAAKPGFGDRVRLKPDFTISPGQALRLDCTSTVHSSIAHLVSIVLGYISFAWRKPDFEGVRSIVFQLVYLLHSSPPPQLPNTQPKLPLIGRYARYWAEFKLRYLSFALLSPTVWRVTNWFCSDKGALLTNSFHGDNHQKVLLITNERRKHKSPFHVEALM